MDAEGETDGPGEAGRHGRFVYWRTPPPITDPLGVAQHGSVNDRWTLAGQQDLDDEVLELLLHSGDTEVAASLGGNSAVPTRVLEQLAELHPEHRHWISLNPEAPVHMKEAIPVGDHSNYALVRYFQQKGAPADVREAIYQRYNAGPHPGGPLLGDVWRDVVGAGGAGDGPSSGRGGRTAPPGR